MWPALASAALPRYLSQGELPKCCKHHFFRIALLESHPSRSITPDVGFVLHDVKVRPSVEEAKEHEEELAKVPAALVGKRDKWGIYLVLLCRTEVEREGNASDSSCRCGEAHVEERGTCWLSFWKVCGSSLGAGTRINN